MKSHSYYIYTFGCKMNQYDSCTMSSMLDKKGYSQLAEPEDADIIIINTCTVTGKTDQRARGLIRKSKKVNPHSVLIVTGCYAEREPEIVDKLSEIDYIVGNSDKKRIGEIIDAIQSNKNTSKIFHHPVGSEEKADFFPLTGFGEHTRAFLKIQDGCNSNCTYCIIPEVRGKSRSVPAGRVLEEAIRLGEQGYKEIVLTGIHIGMYGVDLQGNPNLPDLTEKLSDIRAIERIRISSIEPMEVSEELIKLIQNNNKIADHLHIPLQSGSNKVLKAMNRPYTRDQYRSLIVKLRKEIPSIGIGADVIVGFPGESDEDFQDTVDIINSSPLNYLHVFRYSKRPGTPAAEMEEQVHSSSITERSVVLRKISEELKTSFRNNFIGKELSCLTLEKPEKEGKIRALSSNYIHVQAGGSETDLNRIVNIRITCVAGENTIGTILS